MGRYSRREPCPNSYPEGCDCYTCVSDRKSAGGGGSSRTWEKTTQSYDRDTGSVQSNFFSGTIGERNQKKKVHVAIDELGNITFVRDEDGTILYDKKNNVGHLPPGFELVSVLTKSRGLRLKTSPSFIFIL